MARQHSEKWFRKQEERLMEPFKNTKRYYRNNLLLHLYSSAAWGNWKTCKQLIAQSLEQTQSYLGRARAVTFCGAPGVGKTFSAKEFAIAVSAQQWQKLQSDYLMQSSLINRWIADGDTDQMTAFLALEESYWFYKERESEYIPCLVSTVPIQDIFGRYSYVLNDSHALQQVRLPDRSVLFNDESGSTQGANTSRNASCDILDFYRFYRHFGDFILINTDQGGDGNAKYIRKSTDYNIRLSRQQSLMAPETAQNRLEKQKTRYFKRKANGGYSERRAQYIGEKLYYREKYLQTVGFRCIPYRFEASEGNVMERQNGEYIFSARGNGTYNDRAYRNLYKCRNQELKLTAWQSLTVPEEDPHRFDDQIMA